MIETKLTGSFLGVGCSGGGGGVISAQVSKDIHEYAQRSRVREKHYDVTRNH